MRILYTSMAPGIPAHFFEIARNLADMGNEMVVIVAKYRPFETIDCNCTIKFVPTFRKKWLSYLWAEILRPVYLGIYVLKFKPKVIYARKDSLDLLPPIIAKFLHIPYVVEVNGIIEDEQRLWGAPYLLIFAYKLIEKINYLLATKIVCVTEGIRRELIKRFRVAKEKLVVVPNGVNTELFRPCNKHECRHKLGLKKDAFYVGFVGSFAPWQGLETLIEAVRWVKKQGYHRIKYILVGDGKQEPILKQMVREYNLEQQVQFTGRVPYEQVVSYINVFDVCYLCKERLAFGFSPLKLYEYLACGCPVIASRVDGVKEVIEEGQCGYLFAVGDAEELAKRIIQSYQERETLQEMGVRGRRLIENKYSWRATTEKIAGVLNEIMKIEMREKQ